MSYFMIDLSQGANSERALYFGLKTDFLWSPGRQGEFAAAPASSAGPKGLQSRKLAALSGERPAQSNVGEKWM